MTRLLSGVALIAALALSPLGCSTSPSTEEGKAELSGESATALGRFRAADPSLQGLLDTSAGWAILPDVGKGAAGVGGAYGKGEVFERGLKVGYCDMTQGSVGLQLGGQRYSELIVFISQGALDDFKHNGDFTFGTNISAVAVKEGAAKSADTAKGVVVFIHDQAGLMAEASVSGQKFRFRPL